MLLEAGALPAEFGSVVRPFFSSMLHLDCDARVALVEEEYAHLREKLAGRGGPLQQGLGEPGEP